MNRTWDVAATGDILIGSETSPVTASWFGGGNDPGDDGQTASGVMNDGRDPNLMGCALPFPTCPATKGSPLPTMPYLTTFVMVESAKGSVRVPVIDVGPALDENRPIDLTQAAFVALGGDLKAGLLPVWFRIVGGAQYLA